HLPATGTRSLALRVGAAFPPRGACRRRVRCMHILVPVTPVLGGCAPRGESPGDHHARDALGGGRSDGSGRSSHARRSTSTARHRGAGWGAPPCSGTDFV